MADFVVPDLKIAPREGYARGQEGYEQILHAALEILVEQGSKALTLRTIAAQCGLKPGHLAYYFKTKEDLFRELLNGIISAYEEAFDAIFHDPDASAEERLERIVELVLEDITTKKTTRVFPELWAMANHDPFVEERVDECYRRARVVLNDLIAEINPALPAGERETLALFISASMEGTTVFAGYEKKHRQEMPAIKRIAVKSFLHTIVSLRPGEIWETAADRADGEAVRSSRAARRARG